PRGQLHLPAVLAYAGTADNNTTTAHGQACVSASPTYWVPCGALGLDRAAQPLSVLLKHLVEGFQPLLYHELVQLVANDGCQSQRSLFRHVSLFAALLSSGILLHGGSFRWCLSPEIISGSNEDRHLCVQLRSTASGTSPRCAQHRAALDQAREYVAVCVCFHCALRGLVFKRLDILRRDRANTHHRLKAVGFAEGA